MTVFQANALASSVNLVAALSGVVTGEAPWATAGHVLASVTCAYLAGVYRMREHHR